MNDPVPDRAANAAASAPPALSFARLSRVRHDLRNPLGEILGFTDILIEEAEEQGLRDLLPGLRTIEHAAASVLAEVNHRLSSSATPARPEEITELDGLLRRQTELVIETANQLSARCDDLENNAFGDDLLRITSSARKLRELAPGLLDGLVQSLGQPEPPTSEAAFDTTLLPQLAVIAYPPGHPAGGRLGGLVLVVDDDESNRTLLARRLRREGYTVALAETGRHALEKVRQRKFDLVLLDIIMPEMDGLEVLRRLKGDPATQHLPVLMLSAVDEMDAVVRCIELGADDYLPKPFPPPLLRARVRACLASKRMTDQLRRYTEWLFGKSLFAQAVASPGSLQLQRQERTLLFADIRGFTEWSEQHSPEEVVAMLNEYLERAEQILAPSGVIKTEYTGDEILGVFAQPLEAVQVAVAIRAQVNAYLAERHLGVGLGLHAGPVIEGLMGSADVKAYCVVGDTVNTARRVCDHARSGEILLSEAVQNRVRESVELGDVFELMVKGKREPLHLAALHKLKGKVSGPIIS